MYSKRTMALTLAAALLGACMLGCGKPRRDSYFAMDTFVTLEAYGFRADAALEACRRETLRIEGLMSVASETGDIYRVNHADGEPVRVAAETAEALERALLVSEATGGAFDPTVYPLVLRWGFTGGRHRVVDDDELAQCLPLVGWEKVSVSGDLVALPRGSGLDLGGVAKGYATDRLVAILRGMRVRSALLSLGGNVYALGHRPNGGDWRIAVQNPDGAGVVGVVRASDTAVITAGSYQRFFVEDGVCYHHILDPKTGRPAQSGLTSVTVVCPDATRADALSTALFVMGLADATAYWRGDGSFGAIFISDDGTVSYTEGLPFEAYEQTARIIAK